MRACFQHHAAFTDKAAQNTRSDRKCLTRMVSIWILVFRDRPPTAANVNKRNFGGTLCLAVFKDMEGLIDHAAGSERVG